MADAPCSWRRLRTIDGNVRPSHPRLRLGSAVLAGDLGGWPDRSGSAPQCPRPDSRGTMPRRTHVPRRGSPAAWRRAAIHPPRGPVVSGCVQCVNRICRRGALVRHVSASAHQRRGMVGTGAAASIVDDPSRGRRAQADHPRHGMIRTPVLRSHGMREGHLQQPRRSAAACASGHSVCTGWLGGRIAASAPGIQPGGLPRRGRRRHGDGCRVADGPCCCVALAMRSQRTAIAMAGLARIDV